MRVSKIILPILFLLLWTLSSQPLARVIEEDSVYVSQINEISVAAGILPLSASPPLTGYDLQHQIERLKQLSSLSSPLRSRLNTLEQELFPQEKTFISSSITFSPELYTNIDENAKEWDWVHRYNDRSPVFSIQAETIFAEHLYGIFTYGLEKRLDESDFQGTSISFPFLEDFSETNLQNNFPQTAYLSYASDHITTVFGRDTLSWGQGNTGNLVLGNQAPYHDFLLASTSNDILKYSFLSIPMNELDANGAAIIPEGGDSVEYWNTLFHGTNVRIAMAHRLEARFTPRLRVSLTEWTMHYADRLDMRMFSPVMLLHNYQNFGEVNNTMTLEIESILTKGLLLDFQFFLDQLQTAGEMEAYDDAPPNAFAALLGLRYSKNTEQGSLSGYIEGVYTSPFVYFRSGDHTESYGVDPLTMYNLDFVHSVYSRDGMGSVNYLGYRYGPDTIVVATHLKYTRNKEFEVFGDLRFIAEGERGLIAEQEDQSLLFGEEATGLVSPSGNATYHLIAGVGGFYDLKNIPVRVYGNTSFTNTWEHDGTYSHDIQLTLGVRYTLRIF